MLCHRVDERHTDAVVLDKLAHVEVTAVDVFHAAMMFKVVGHI